MWMADGRDWFASASLLSAGAVTVALLACGVASRVARRRSGAVRNHIWRAGLLTLWLVPAAALLYGCAPLAPIRVVASAPLSPPHHPWYVVEDSYTARRAGAPEPPAPDAGLTPALRAALSLPTSPPTYRAWEATRPLPAWVHWWRVVWAAYALGVTLAIVAWGRDLWALLGLLGACRDGKPGSPEVATANLISAGVCLRRAPRVCIAGIPVAPFVLGLPFARRLVLPPEANWSGPSARAVVLHELAHLVRRDPEIQTLARVTLVLWWWHPLVWVLERQLRVTAEEAADDWAMADTDDRRTYSLELLRIAETTAAHCVGGSSYRGGVLAARVRRVLADGCDRARRAPGSLRLACASLALLMAVPVSVFSLDARAPTGSPVSVSVLSSNDREAMLKRACAGCWAQSTGSVTEAIAIFERLGGVPPEGYFAIQIVAERLTRFGWHEPPAFQVSSPSVPLGNTGLGEVRYYQAMRVRWDVSWSGSEADAWRIAALYDGAEAALRPELELSGRELQHTTDREKLRPLCRVPARWILDADPRVQQYAFEFVPRDEEALEYAVRTLRTDARADSRRRAAEALAEWDEYGGAVTPALLDTLADPNQPADVRATAIWSLALLRASWERPPSSFHEPVPDAARFAAGLRRDAPPYLREAMRDTSQANSVRASAAGLLVLLGETVTEDLDGVLFDALRDPLRDWGPRESNLATPLAAVGALARDRRRAEDLLIGQLEPQHGFGEEVCAALALCPDPSDRVFEALERFRASAPYDGDAVAALRALRGRRSPVVAP